MTELCANFYIRSLLIHSPTNNFNNSDQRQVLLNWKMISLKLCGVEVQVYTVWKVLNKDSQEHIRSRNCSTRRRFWGCVKIHMTYQTTLECIKLKRKIKKLKYLCRRYMAKHVYYKKLEWNNTHLKRESHVMKAYSAYKNLKQLKQNLITGWKH